MPAHDGLGGGLPACVVVVDCDDERLDPGEHWKTGETAGGQTRPNGPPIQSGTSCSESTDSMPSPTTRASDVGWQDVQAGAEFLIVA